MIRREVVVGRESNVAINSSSTQLNDACYVDVEILKKNFNYEERKGKGEKIIVGGFLNNFRGSPLGGSGETRPHFLILPITNK